MDSASEVNDSPLPTPDSNRTVPLGRPEWWMAIWMAVAFFIIKLIHFGLPASWNMTGLGNYAQTIFIATAGDNLFVLIIGLCAALTLTPLRRHPRAYRFALGGWIAFGALCLAYAILNSFVFAFAKSPLTRDLLGAAGDWENLRSSLMYYVDTPMLASLTAGPLAYVLAITLAHRFLGEPRRWLMGLVVALLILGVASQLAFSIGARREWRRRDDWRIAINPHWAFFSTWVLGRTETTAPLAIDFPASYEADFLPVRERAASARETGDTARQFSGKPRHVILFVLESTGTQFLHLYNKDFQSTPNLDAEARNSLVFEQFYSHVGLTPAAMVAMSNSNYARMRHPKDYNVHNPPNQPGISLPQVLKAHGFRTLALTSGDLRFAQQDDFLKAGAYDQIWDKHNIAAPDLTSWGKADGPMVDKLFEWIDRDPAHATPFFAICWTNQTHHPYTLLPDQATRDLIGGFSPPSPAIPDLINRYLNCLLEADRQIGRLLAGLRKRGLADDTLVVITGDHGDSINFPHAAMGHGFRLFEEQLHIPLVLWNPRLYSPGRRIATLGGQIDLAPTIADIFAIPSAPTWQGYSLFDPARTPRVYYCAKVTDYYLGVREGDWKYIYNASTDLDELYNLRLDPGEMHDVYAANPEICLDLRRRVAAWASYQDRHGAGVKP